MTTAFDSRVHHAVVRHIVAHGHAPTTSELAEMLHASPSEVEASLRRLHDGHGLVLHPGTTEVWIAHPFSLSPTPVWVACESGGWWAPCLWCATGIITLAAPNAAVHVRLGGEAEETIVRFEDGRLVSEELLVHFSTPPRAAWANVVHYCATVLPFRRLEDVDEWCARHRLPRGAVVPLPQVLELGRAWYGRHLNEDWRKWTIAEAQEIFKNVGLIGEFWKLPVEDRPF